MTRPAIIKGRILIVEDDPGVATVLDELLSMEGFEPRNATNGPDALALMEDWLPDAVLLDLNLPGISGRDLVQRIRELPSPVASVPIIVVTGAHGGVESADEIGAVAAIRKPFALDRVLDAIETALGNA